MAWAITPEDRAKYTAVFEGLNPENGKLSGETVRPVLMKSGLEVAKDGFNFKLIFEIIENYFYSFAHGTCNPFYLANPGVVR